MKKTIIAMLISVFMVGCASIPPEITKAHDKELEIIEALKASHLAMVDSFVDQKLLAFEDFFFKKYGPVYRTNWIESFKEKKGRDYTEEKDFPLFYNDLVAEYQDLIKPIEDTRFDLKTSIITEYSNLIALHETTGNWIVSLKNLNESQRKTMNSFLGSIKPGFSMDSMDAVIESTKAKVLGEIENKTE